MIVLGHGFGATRDAGLEPYARRAGSLASVRHYPIGHFDIYVGDDFERSVTDQVEFLTKALAIETEDKNGTEK